MSVCACIHKCTKNTQKSTKSKRTTEQVPTKSILHTVVACAEVYGRDNEVRLEIPASFKCFKSVSLETYLVKTSAGLSVPKTFRTVIMPEVIKS